MWNWDQGRLDYFQFDNLKKIARFALANNLKMTERNPLVAATGLPFLPDDPRYKPWRNYKRVFTLSLIVAEDGGRARPTKLASLLAADGGITTDEYFHFLAEATTEPSPALRGWDHTAEIRRPLLFALKFLLTRAGMGMFTTSISEIVASFGACDLVGLAATALSQTRSVPPSCGNVTTGPELPFASWPSAAVRLHQTGHPSILQHFRR